ncbi:hypothetical protein A2331_02185 [Candidatus Falkowbacteria bacterium RIFOXYB2_FULL_34_18]|uniref:PABS domain-containing protein n=1 Tax=Candidatus Falkowbacteria bacterium RIFOXYD2_FULL_34_120 TaxID=1798007 RepID=A0A1F5TR85_9BACT|nr:MAG: hypothetical protein A2331_02185 [Candidatus Falkowbacteria bacterium RIFOXYB2_FULL_34_18]OGF29549.1 MAG: hypothetical protein A2500_02345 [Candidatus Falkowbacteria bacterium RIFOXYC12_FULL_34_55]OGF36884.1 MAG: hypothetical protein A2466_06625 [Candidatus Falkowbacteria bacterium RIFOXYC2_FULL_34_220]OGF39083.1 MAG: hypothetical protein A2515_04630 [Candidatus Falkowbacteria bacterium RIFOXYD12_FULL_34_57]OGF41307.1 MAG: hypothetical protein A2531_00260 [Candidatus Falkowbacteria bact
MLEITVFICGAIVMIFELVGSRVLGPYLGTSIFVWTSLIGVILGSLSIGYILGGKIADKKSNLRILSLIIFFAGIYINLTMFTKESIIIFLQNSFIDIRLSSVFASIILFAPTSILLGMVSPYAIKLKLNNLSTSGSTVGNLYAISTIGSIIGTFSSGFYLIPAFGTTKILLILSLSLIILSIILSSKQLIKTKFTFIFLISISWLTVGRVNYLLAQNGFIDVDTKYNHVQIIDYQDAETGKPARGLRVNNESSSAMFIDDGELVFEYTKYYNLIEHFNPSFKKSLVIGGAAFSYPKYYLKAYPEASMDVVEIDPKLTEFAKTYFYLQENPRLNIYHEDGRTFLNKTSNKYDAILGDAFKSHYSIPYQLTTREAIQKKYDILNDGGVVILNIISSIGGISGQFLRAEYATYKQIFPQVYLFPVNNQLAVNNVQNIILVALKSSEIPKFKNENEELNKYLEHLWTGKIEEDMPIITDDHAPVDYYISKIIK